MAGPDLCVSVLVHLSFGVPFLECVERHVATDITGRIRSRRDTPTTMGACISKVEDASGVDIDGDGMAGSKRALPTRSLAALLQSTNVTSSQADYRGAGDNFDDGAAVPLSSCTGNKRSLFIGINYIGHSTGVLRGCINDVNNLKEFVVDKFGFPTSSDSMRVLLDDGSGDGMPTKAMILEGMRWLVEGAQNGDSLFFHYSGHGTHQKDVSPDKDEHDGQDEALCPSDYPTAGLIVDDDLHAILVAGLPEGVRLTAIVDACHSGSVFDLPYSYGVSDGGDVQETDNRAVALQAAMAAGMAVINGNMAFGVQKGMEALQALQGGGGGGGGDNPDADENAIQIRSTVADVIQFSGCRDSQTSADANIGGEATGAMSWAFRTAFDQGGAGQSYVALLTRIRTLLQQKYSQVPQMSSGRKLNLSTIEFKM